MIIKDQANAVRAMREMCGASSDMEVEKKTGISRFVISQLRHGKAWFGFSVLYKLACYTDLPMSEIKRRLTDGI